MMTNTPDSKVQEAHAISGALLIARLAGLKLDGPATLPPIAFHNYLHAADASLLLVPSIEAGASNLEMVGRGMLIADCDAVIVRPKYHGSGVTLFCSLGLRQEQTSIWFTPYILFVGPDGTLHLIARDRSSDGTLFSFALTSAGVRTNEYVPWASTTERDTGLAHARTEIASVMDGY